MLVPLRRIEYIDYAVKWFSKGLQVKLEEVGDAYFFFGFRRDSIYDCFNTMHDRIERLSGP